LKTQTIPFTETPIDPDPADGARSNRPPAGKNDSAIRGETTLEFELTPELKELQQRARHFVEQ